jgi:uncharacterized protein (TIGR03905 family)
MIIARVLNGVCAKSVTLSIDENKLILGIDLEGGCDGQRQALNALACGMPVDSFIKRVQDITCGRRSTSCVAEIAKVLQQTVN